MTATKEIHKLDYVNEGVRYTIHVEEGEGGTMWGTWECHDCGFGGSSSRTSKTIVQAVAAAKDDTERHQMLHHAA